MTRQCKNATCTAQTSSTWCSRRCQNTARTRSNCGQLPDIWVGMDTERALRQCADTLGVTIRDLIVNLLEAEVAPLIGWDRLNFGPIEDDQLSLLADDKEAV